jgi:hypothetical protein
MVRVIGASWAGAVRSVCGFLRRPGENTGCVLQTNKPVSDLVERQTYPPKCPLNPWHFPSGVTSGYNPVLVLAGTHAGVYLDTKGVINTPSGSMVRVIGAIWARIGGICGFLLGNPVRTWILLSILEPVYQDGVLTL